jgi:hypothetical protein
MVSRSPEAGPGPQSAPTRSARRTFGYRGSIALIVAGLALSGVLVARRSRPTVETQIAALRAAGEPFEVADFARLHPEPDPEHDFDALVDQLPAYRSVDDRTAYLTPGRGGALPPETRHELSLIVASNRPALDILLGTDLAGFRKRQNWHKGWLGRNEFRVFPDIELARCLELEIVHATETGDAERAVTALERGLQMARLSQGGGIIGAIGQLAVEAITLLPLPPVLERLVLSDAQLHRLERALPRREDLLVEALRAERAQQVWLRRDLPRMWSYLTGSPHPPLGSGLLHMLPTESLRARSLNRWNRRVAAARLPARERMAGLTEWSSHPWDGKPQPPSAFAYLVRCLRLDDVIDHNLEPRLIQFASDDLARQAVLANALTVVAIERWRLAHGGRPPESLTELVPTYLREVPSDPFDPGRRVSYRSLPNGYVVHGVGPNYADDGGPGDPDGAPANDDPAWRRTFPGPSSPEPGVPSGESGS